MVLLWLAGGAFFSAVATSEYPDMQNIPRHDDILFMVDALLGLLACLLLPLVRGSDHRRAGRASLVVALTSLASAWSGPMGLYTLFTVARWRDRRRLLIVAVATLAASIGSQWVMPGSSPSLVDSLLMAAMVALICLWGLYRGSRSALAQAHRERAQSLEREQAATLAQARAEERTAIAREIHDTLSHRLAVISLHAGGLSMNPGMGPEQVLETAELLQRTAQGAGEELHDLLTVLREDPGDRVQAPTLASLDAVVAEARELGTPVSLHLEEALGGTLDTLATQRSTALFHVVHEGLANAAKHAPGQPVDVTIEGCGPGVRVVTTNPLARAGGEQGHELAGGHGLLGLEERLTLAGGRLDHGVEQGRYRLEAWVPWN